MARRNGVDVTSPPIDNITFSKVKKEIQIMHLGGARVMKKLRRGIGKARFLPE